MTDNTPHMLSDEDCNRVTGGLLPIAPRVIGMSTMAIGEEDSSPLITVTSHALGEEDGCSRRCCGSLEAALHT